jgi:hypothetical protein
VLKVPTKMLTLKTLSIFEDDEHLRRCSNIFEDAHYGECEHLREHLRGMSTFRGGISKILPIGGPEPHWRHGEVFARAIAVFRKEMNT